MADHADDGDNDVFVYMGGLIPQHLRETITHVRVHKSVKIIREGAFMECHHLVSIEMHDGVEIIEIRAFSDCECLKEIKLSGVRVIEHHAFMRCASLADVEFGNKLETIGPFAFARTDLKNVKIPKVRVIGDMAFNGCGPLTDVELSKDLETIGNWAFSDCPRLRRIAIPLKDNLLPKNFVFSNCDDLSQVDLIGGIHKTISSLLLDSWRNDINDEIDGINRDLPNTPSSSDFFETASGTGLNKTLAIQRWMGRVLEKIDHFKQEHYTLLKNNMTLLELALWDANLQNDEATASRHEARVTCGANIIIPHVLSFLNDYDEFPLLGYDKQ